MFVVIAGILLVILINKTSAPLSISLSQLVKIPCEYDNKARDRDIELVLVGIRKVDITAIH